MASASPRLSRHSPAGATASPTAGGLKRKSSLYGSSGSVYTLNSSSGSGSSLCRRRSSSSYNSLDEIYSPEMCPQPLDKVPKREEIETPIWTIIDIDVEMENGGLNDQKMEDKECTDEKSSDQKSNDQQSNDQQKDEKLNDQKSIEKMTVEEKSTDQKSIDNQSNDQQKDDQKSTDQKSIDNQKTLTEEKVLNESDNDTDEDNESFASFKHKRFTEDSFYAELHSQKEAEEREYYYERLKGDHRYPRTKLKEMKDSIEEIRKPEYLKTYVATIIPEDECTWEYQGKLMAEWKASLEAQNNNSNSNNNNNSSSSSSDKKETINHTSESNINKCLGLSETPFEERGGDYGFNENDVSYDVNESISDGNSDCSGESESESESNSEDGEEDDDDDDDDDDNDNDDDYVAPNKGSAGHSHSHSHSHSHHHSHGSSSSHGSHGGSGHKSHGGSGGGHKGSSSSNGGNNSSRKHLRKNVVLDYDPSNIDYSFEWEIVRKTELLGYGARKPTMFYLRCTNSKK